MAKTIVDLKIFDLYTFSKSNSVNNHGYNELTVITNKIDLLVCLA
jgi:hypothetical protein